MRYTFASSRTALVANGRGGILTPWHITIDTDEQTITVGKKNWYLIGTDEDTVAFRFIRRVIINEHLIGADLTIHVAGGSLHVYCLEKEDCKRIKQILTDYNKTRKSSIVFS